MTSSAEVQITRETDFSKDVFKSDKEDSVSHNFVVACSSFLYSLATKTKILLQDLNVHSK